MSDDEKVQEARAAIKRAMNDGPWDDADVELFVDRLAECGVHVFLIEDSATWDPKDAVDSGPEEAIARLPADLLAGFLFHRRDIACWLRSLRGERRMMAVAEALEEMRRVMAPVMREIAALGLETRGSDLTVLVQGVPLDQIDEDDDDRKPDA
jgi:hypothetical protein